MITPEFGYLILAFVAACLWQEIANLYFVALGRRIDALRTEVSTQVSNTQVLALLEEICTKYETRNIRLFVVPLIFGWLGMLMLEADLYFDSQRLRSYYR